jgi:hypothetical protein
MVITRLYAKTNPDKLWKSVVEELGDYRSSDITPFYVPQSVQDFITISLQVKATDSVVGFLEHVMDFLTQKVARMDGLADSHTMPLIKLRFLPILKELPAAISRYTIEVKVHPPDYCKMYDSLLEARYDRDLAVTYIAYLFGEYDLLLSLLATDRLKVEEFELSRKDQECARDEDNCHKENFAFDNKGRLGQVPNETSPQTIMADKRD